MDTTILGDTGGRLMIAILGVGIGLLVLVGVLWWMKNRPSSPFIRGGRTRQPRLAVLDAAAVDTRRRLVLVRRDDVEHLILIGGPTDVVIESRIVGASAGQQPAPAAERGATPTPETRAPDGRTEIASVDRCAAERAPVQPQSAPRERTAPAAQVDPTISNAGAALYGEQAVTMPRPTAQVATPAAAPQTTEQRRPVQPAAAQPALRETARPEDILEAARLRVMPQAAQPQVVQPQGPQAIAAQPVADARIIQQPARNPAGPTSDFERLLDAEISGDLQRITPDARDTAGRGQPAAAPRAAAQATAATPTQRREPSLEEEMFRLLEERDNRGNR
ncbi:flagellar biosynthetic protein FliO [Rhizobium sp. SG2393]|uniref:flagellar biosynthetic protein FliO n=1 Tax=Rhizobium sp. SG2393 TaxID=3276279 RepID=UPI00366B8F72